MLDLSAGNLLGSVIASTLVPFNEHGLILTGSITDQAQRLARIDGITGIAVNTTVRERQTMSSEERLEVIRRTRSGIDADQLLLSCVDELSDVVIDDVAACKEAGANAVISFPAKWQKGYEGRSIDERMIALADQLPLPVILTLGTSGTRRSANIDDIMPLAQHSQKVIGFEMGSDDDVLHYDQDYYALKSLDRPLACLPSSEGALFHNLNTGGDGVLSSLAYIAPHEVAALYSASRDRQILKAQAIHDRLAPLVRLLNGHDANTREMIYREIAHTRCLLASPTARGLAEPLCPHLTASLHSTLDDIALEPISWV